MLDPDEIIVPYRANTYHNMMMKLAKDKQVILNGSSISFIMKFFFIKETAHVNKNETLISMRHTAFASTKLLDGADHCNSKSFVFPARCIYTYAHGCTYSPFKRYYASLNTGSTHHYRQSCEQGLLGQGGRDCTRNGAVESNLDIKTKHVCLKFKQNLLQRFEQVIRRV